MRSTWAPRGQTPTFRAVHDRRSVSAIAAITVSPDSRRLGHFLHLWRDAIDAQAVEVFLEELLRQWPGRIILIWDRLGAHRKAVANFAQTHPRLWVEWLPPYAPELNPVEWLWAWMKGSPMNGLCPEDVDELLDAITDAHHQITPQLLDGFLRGPGILSMKSNLAH